MKQIFVINSDLKMTAGKLAVQVAHGETYYMQHIKTECRYTNLPSSIEIMQRYNSWLPLMKKVVLKATEKELRALIWSLKDKVLAFPVHDAGLTQIPPNSFTCICVEPLEDSIANNLFSHLKLA